MMLVEIDGAKVEAERDVLAALREQLFPDRGFGWNRSSLLDALSTDVPRPVTIVWKHCRLSAERLGPFVFGELCALLASIAAQDVEWQLEDRLEVHLQ